jgi:hypothetical protein
MKIGLVKDSKKRAEKFFNEVLESGNLYIVYAAGTEKFKCFYSNNFSSENGEPALVIPIWSKQFIPYARHFMKTDYIEEISLKKFLELWLPDLDYNGMMIGLNWDGNGVGFECPAGDLYDLLQMLNEKLESNNSKLIDNFLNYFS